MIVGGYQLNKIDKYYILCIERNKMRDKGMYENE